MGNEYKNDEIITYQIKTHEYFGNRNYTDKYYINSEDELNIFYSLYSKSVDINKEYLKDNSIFIQVQMVGSGSIRMKLSSVTFENNNVNFIIERNSPQIGTCDMACWYLVAVIPNEQLKNLNLNGWCKPSEMNY